MELILRGKQKKKILINEALKNKVLPSFQVLFEAFLAQNFEKIFKLLYEIFKQHLFKMGEFDFFVF